MASHWIQRDVIDYPINFLSSSNNSTLQESVPEVGLGKLSGIAKRLLKYFDNGLKNNERSDFGTNISLSRLGILPNSI